MQTREKAKQIKIKENNKEEKDKMRNKKGISLIVLVITIIVMIILAAAVIISLSNSGVINRANQAVNATNIAEVQHLASLAWSEAYLDNMNLPEEERDVKIKEAVEKALTDNDLNPGDYNLTYGAGGVTVTAKGGNTKVWTQIGHTVTDGTTTLTVGDYIDYKANVSGYTDENGWRVLGAENGEILLVSSTEVVDSLELGGTTLKEAQDAYAGGALAALQTAVNNYGNGDKATGVRSIKGEDIDRIAEYDVTTFTYLGLVKSMGEDTSAMTEEEKNAYKITDYGRIVTFSWDGTTKPVYSFKDGENTITGSLNYTHSSKFVWYDETSKAWCISTKKSVSGIIADDTNTTITASITNNLPIYLGKELDEDTAAYEMLIANDNGNLEYWLASPYRYVMSENAVFGLRAVNSGVVGEAVCFVYSSGNYSTSSNGVRAVVSLESEVELKSAGTNSWTIAN